MTFVQKDGPPGAGQSTEGMNSDQAMFKINRDLEEKRTQEKAQELKIPYINVGAFPVNPDILHLIPLEEAQGANVMLFYKSGKSAKLAVGDPENAATKTLVQRLTDAGYTLELQLASSSSITEAHRLYASDQYKLKTEVKNTMEEGEVKYEKELANMALLKDKLPGLPAEEALNTLNVSAIKAGASDVHFEPEEKSCSLRLRIDGVLHLAFEMDRELSDRLMNQLKYKAGMKLNITNVPQDGRFRFIINERKIDVRVSSIPTEYGEAFVCRILDSGKKYGSFEDLGFSGRSLDILKRAQELAQGMILVTGPTGSGKTTTLYVALTALNQPDAKVITLEDPIEYHLRGVTQSQINEKRGYNFADGLRSILRQDPDVVMIGEIRDLETAQAAMQAALTGHVVLSTLHTNSAVETVSRFTTIGVPNFMMAQALSVVIAQRLVRRLCTACVVERDVTQDDQAALTKVLGEIHTVDPSHMEVVPPKLKVPHGCEACSGTGFRGQMTIAEVLMLDTDIREAILENKSAGQILAIARTKGMLTMVEDGILKALKGFTTIEEIKRVTAFF